MKIDVKYLVSYEELQTDLNGVLEKVDENGKVIVLKKNKPAYILQSFDEDIEVKEIREKYHIKKLTLQDAMKVVLQDAAENKMHAADLAEEIYNRGLYYKKDGSKAEYNQIRARCGHYPDMFDTLPGNIIVLKGK